MDSDELWASKKTADYLEVSVRTLDHWAYRGEGPRFAKIGRSRRYRRSDVEQWVEQQMVR